MLARLAGETGGRLTHATNDLSLGYARAQRDLGCRYTIGFYLSDREADHERRIAVHLIPPGLRALHPDHYRFRSPSAQMESEIAAAFMVPKLFEGGVRAHVFTLQPRTKSSWDTLTAISFPVGFETVDSVQELDFGALLIRGPRVVHRFNRRVTLRPRSQAALGERRFMFLEPADLEPGTYDLRVVMVNANGEERPGAATATVEIPPIPRKDVMMVQPILGRPRDRNVVVRGTGPSVAGRSPGEPFVNDIVAARGSFEPMLVQRALDADKLLTRNKACLVGGKRTPEATIERAISREGENVMQLASVELDLVREQKVACQNLFEILDENSIEPGGYVFEAMVSETQDGPGHGSMPFAVDGAEDAAKR